MTYRELIRKLEALGCFYRSQGQGSHGAVAKPKQRQDNQHSKTRQSGPEDRNAPLHSQAPENIEGRLRLGLSRHIFMREPELL